MACLCFFLLLILAADSEQFLCLSLFYTKYE